jgi:two-component system OmpR family sensor kinase
MITDSLRGQLTLWYTGVLALVLIAFAVATYEYLGQAAQQRTDRSLADTANGFIATLLTEVSDENQSVSVSAAEAASTFHFPDRQIIVYDQQHKVIAASSVPENIRGKEEWFSSTELSPSLIELLDSATRSGQSYTTRVNKSDGIRLLAKTAHSREETITVLLMQSLREQAEALQQARRAFYLAVPLALLLASAGGYFLARKSLAPVIAMSNQAARIGASNLDERLPVPDSRNELSRLAQIFNDLLARIDRSFAQQRRFMADASHELRTPVAIVCGESEVALSREERSREDYRESLKIVHEEGQRLTRVVEDLFMLARADAGQYPLVYASLYLDETIGNCVRSLRSLVAEKELSLDYDSPAKEMPFRGDEALIRRMVLNLLDNSIKYTMPGGKIRVDLKQSNNDYSIVVADTGAGIPAEAQPHVFERFFRVDKARSRNEETDGSGAGLGLSIASWIAERHGGRITLNHSDQNGTKFIISLPIVT